MIHPLLSLDADAGDRRALAGEVTSVAGKGRPGSSNGHSRPCLALALAGCSQQPLGSGSRWRLTGMGSAAMLSGTSLAGGRREEALEGRGAGLGA